MQDELTRALKIDAVRWGMIVMADGSRLTAGQAPDEIARGAIAAMVLAIQETLQLARLGGMTDLWLATDRVALYVVGGGSLVLVLAVDAAKANVGLVRVQARRVLGRLLEGAHGGS